MPEQLLIDYQIECTDLKRVLALAEEIISGTDCGNPVILGQGGVVSKTYNRSGY